MYYSMQILLFASYAAACKSSLSYLDPRSVHIPLRPQTITIPKGQLNGLYSVFTAENGTETHTLIKLHDPSSSIDVTRDLSNGPLAKLATAKRQIPNVGGDNPKEDVQCGGYFLDVGNTNDANGLLDGQCGNGAFVGPNLDFYSIVGCTVSYFCNFSYYPEVVFPFIINIPIWTQCWANDRRAVANEINSKCGGFGAGWSKFTTANNEYNGQYGWEDQCNHNSFCGRGTNGK